MCSRQLTHEQVVVIGGSVLPQLRSVRIRCHCCCFVLLLPCVAHNTSQHNVCVYVAVVPAGYYLKSPGQAAPCPKGEWKSGVGADGNCTKCAFGVTTESVASTSELNCTSKSRPRGPTKNTYCGLFVVLCGVVRWQLAVMGLPWVCPLWQRVQFSSKNLQVKAADHILCCMFYCPAAAVVSPGYYASQMNGGIVTAVAVCPQKWYCGGGRPVGPFDPLRPTWIAPTDTTVKACPDGLWTQSMGATTLQQCCKCLLTVAS